MRRRISALVTLVAIFVALAAPMVLAVVFMPRAGDIAHVRFRLDAARAAQFVHARPLFGDDVPTVAGAPDLASWWVIDTFDARATSMAVFAAGARFIDREPAWEPAAVREAARDDGPSCPIQTPAYDARQGYRAALAIDGAWNQPGGRGQGVAVADVEGEWNDKHEDLPSDRIKHVAGVRQRAAGWRAHGTAVLGVVAAKDNGKGMLGLAPEVTRIVTASLGGIGAARAIYEAARALAPGDVLIVELHGPGPNADGRGQKGFVPMEFWQPEFDAIRWATKKGVIVVEAAGNGGEDLDAPVYGGKFDRRLRDSEAILVGAADWDRKPLGFSNAGSRVDMHGWGGGVATLDYGDLQGCSVPARKYTALFSGTSSASPVVAGAAIVVQGVAKNRGHTLTPREMRTLLAQTGTPQREGKRIGPLPHVARAIASLRE